MGFIIGHAITIVKDYIVGVILGGQICSQSGDSLVTQNSDNVITQQDAII